MFDPNRYNHRNAFEGIGWLIAGLILLPMTLVCFGIFQIFSKCCNQKQTLVGNSG